MLYDHLSARENLVFFQQMHSGSVSSEYDLDDWLSQVGLHGLGAKPVAAFSRGMKQRLSIARALIHSPDLVLLDEPWTGIDEEGRARLLEVFEETLCDDRIIVIATHLMSEKVRGCDVRLTDGRLESVTEKSA
jgi:ABC-type multidrug transport system ATPase subunit